MMTMDRILYSGTTSTSHIFGNITESVIQMLRSKLPHDFLKGHGVTTSSPFRYYNIFKNTKREFNKKELPFMVIKPIFEPIGVSDEGFINNVPLTRYEGSIGSFEAATQKFLTDKKRGFCLGFSINRYKMSFEVGIQLNTYYQGLDIYSFLRNSTRWEIPEYLPTMLESVIPKDLCVHVGDCIGVDITKKENIPTFMQYMQEHSAYPITYMMRNSSATDEFFVFYNQNVLLTFSDLQLEDVHMKDMAEDMAVVMFRVTCEFNTMANYRMYGAKETFDQLQLCIHTHTDFSDSIGYTPVYTINRIPKDQPLIARGFTKLVSVAIKSDKKKDGQEDSCSFKSIIDPMGLKMVNDLVAHSLPVNILYEIMFMKNDEVLEEGKDYTVNWSNDELIIKESDKYSTYRLIVYINLQYYNNHLLQEYGQDRTDRQDPFDADTAKTGYKT